LFLTPEIFSLSKDGKDNKFRFQVNGHYVADSTGAGKSYIACALAQKACREGYRALYCRLPRLLQDFALARADGRYGKLLANLLKQDLLVIDDWGLAPLDDHGRRDILEIFEDRHNVRSTLVTSQLPVPNWHEMIGDPTLADAILDRLVHNAYKITLKGESMRKTMKPLTQSGH
jgi:DNA replication protein DnaC